VVNIYFYAFILTTGTAGRETHHHKKIVKNGVGPPDMLYSKLIILIIMEDTLPC
jgi:hypothetical protein